MSELLTIQVDRTSRKSLAGSIEALIDMLDDLSPDPDLEDGADAEPWLGWPEQGAHASPAVFNPDLRGTPHDDREDENEYGGDINDEPQAGASGGTWEGDDEHSLGWTEEASLSGDLRCFGTQGDLEDQGDNEPSLGWGNSTGQTGVGVEEWNFDADGGSEGALDFTGEGHDQARQMLRGRGRKEPSLSITIVGPPVTVPGWKGPLSRPDPDCMDFRAHYLAAKRF